MDIITKPDYIALLGPTSFGKTDMLLKLAHACPDAFEIVSVDSVQVYKGMDIGSAKPSISERALVPHHLIDCCDPHNAFTVAMFIAQAKACIKDIHSRGKLPILSGGTMLYFYCFRHGIAEIPAIPSVIRNQVQRLCSDLDSAWGFLSDCDPSSASKIKKTDRQRLARAIEVYLATGKTLSEWQQNTQIQHDYHGEYFLLYPEDRNILHKRIADRFNAMLSMGLVAELQQLLANSPVQLDANYPSIRSIGYRQVWDYLQGVYTYNQMQEKAIVATRRYLKRQCTWLKGWKQPYTIFNDTEICYAALLKLLER